MPPARRPLPRVRSSPDRPPARGDGFQVHRLLVETRPRYWVPCGLWVPDGAANASTPAGTSPAILYAAGHEGPGWRWDGADDWLGGGGDQIVLLNLVQRGFTVLAFDPIGQGERQMYANLTGAAAKGALNGTQAYDATAEHEYVHRQLVLLGSGAASAWVWDMAVLTDHLASLPHVNASSIGAAGCSGGGTQTAYFASVDPRVVAASVACYTSTFIVDYAPNSPPSVALANGTETSWPLGGGGPADGEQAWGPALSAGPVGLDKPDLLVARSPQPTQVLLTSWDNCFPLRGGLFAVNESRPAWSAAQRAGDFEYAVEDNWHGYTQRTRERLYAFLVRTLAASCRANPRVYPGGCSNSTELYTTDDRGRPMMDPNTTWPYHMSAAYFAYGQLRATSTGNVITAPELRNDSVTAHEALVLPLLAAAVQSLRDQRRRGPAAYLRRVRSVAAEVLGVRPPPAAATGIHAPHAKNRGAGGGEPPTLSVDGEGHCKCFYQVWPAAGRSGVSGAGPRTTAERLVLYVARKGPLGRLTGQERARVASLQQQGFAVVTADLCGFGPGGGGDAFFGSNTAAGDRTGAGASRPGASGTGLPMWPRRLAGAGPGGGYVVDLAFNVNRSIVGIHAGDVLRIAGAVVAGRPGATIAATVAANDTAPAVLAAALTAEQPGLLGDLAIVGSFASWEALAASPRYGQQSYYAWAHGVLRHFDLPDLLAATAATAATQAVAGAVPRVLVLSPADALGRRLAPDQAAAAYRFAGEQQRRLEVVANASTAAAETDVLLRWLGAGASGPGSLRGALSGPGVGFNETQWTFWNTTDCQAPWVYVNREVLGECYWEGPTSWSSNCSASGGRIYRTFYAGAEPVPPDRRCAGPPLNVTVIEANVCAAQGRLSSRYQCV